MSRNRYGSGKILMPDNSLLVPAHRQGLGQGGWPASAAGPVRYDSSGARLWYKFEDAGTPLVNSGTLAARDLPYDAVNGDGQATYGVAGLWGDCISMDVALHKCMYPLQVDDSALLGGNVSIWTWIKPLDPNPHNPTYLWGRYAWSSGGILSLRLDAGAVFTVSCVLTGPNNFTYTSAGGAFTYGDSHLFGATWDGQFLRAWIDGSNIGTRDWGGPTTLNNGPTNGWELGNAVGYFGYHSPGEYYEAGFDDTLFDAAKWLNMYHAGVP